MPNRRNGGGDKHARLLASIANLDQLQRVRETGFDVAALPPDLREMWRYILAIADEHERVPRLHDLRQTFNLPAAVTRAAGEFEVLFADFKRYLLTAQMQGILDRASSSYADSPQELLAHVVAELLELAVEDVRQLSQTDASMNARLDKYERWALERGDRDFVGVPTGISYFDEKYGMGWMPGELIGVVGRTYIGKSWLLLYHGMLAWRMGESVVFLSPEMSIEETEARWDSLLFAQRSAPVDVTSLYKGYHPSVAMREIAAETSQHARWMTYASSESESLNVTLVARLVKKHRPRLLIIDGLPLMEAEGGGRNRALWEDVKQLSYALKAVAVRHGITIIVSQQATRKAANTARPPGLHEIAFGDAFAQACDRVLALSIPQQQEQEVLKVTVQKFRRGQPLHSGLDFCFAPGQGRIYELGTGEIASDGAGGGDSEPWQGLQDEVYLP